MRLDYHHIVEASDNARSQDAWPPGSSSWPGALTARGGDEAAAATRVATFDSSRADFTPYGFSCELWSPTVMPRPDRHNEIEINFIPSGTLTYLLGGRVVTVEARHLVVFWAAVPHQILRWETGGPYYVVTLPLAWFLGCGFPDHFAHPILAGEMLTDPESTPADEVGFRQWVDDFKSSQALQERIAQVEIQARLLRVALATYGRRGPNLATSTQPLESSLSRADQLACYIARYYAEPLTAERIAKAVGLHPNYAMTIFRKAFGTTMVDFLLQHRLSHAQHMLLTTDASVIEIAGSAGFQSLSRFNEAFKQACGCAPRDYRKAHRQTQASSESRSRAKAPFRIWAREAGSPNTPIANSR